MQLPEAQTRQFHIANILTILTGKVFSAEGAMGRDGFGEILFFIAQREFMRGNMCMPDAVEAAIRCQHDELAKAADAWMQALGRRPTEADIVAFRDECAARFGEQISLTQL